MSPEQFESITAGIESIATLLALVVGAGWAYRKFVTEREGVARIRFDVSITFVGCQDNNHVLELVAQVENRGRVRHIIRQFGYELRYLQAADHIQLGTAKIANQVNFPHVASNGSWMPKEWEYTFVEPGVCNRYVAVSALPTSATFALLTGRFEYDAPTEFHTAIAAARVPEPLTANSPPNA